MQNCRSYLSILFQLLIIASSLLSGRAIFSQQYTQQRLKLQKIKVPVEQTPSPWILSLLTHSDQYTQPNKSVHSHELNVGYQFTDRFSSTVVWGYSGLINAQNADDAQIWDPEILADYELPLSSSRSLSQWTVLMGTSAVIPAAKSSLDQELMGSLSANLGLRWKYLKFTLEQTNRAYISFYRNSPTYVPYIQGTSSDDSSDIGDQEQENPPPEKTFYNSIHYLRGIYEFTSKLSGKIENIYQVKYNGTDNPVQTWQVFSTIGYYFTPHFRVFGGITSLTQTDEGKKPPIFSEESTALRMGIFLKL